VNFHGAARDQLVDLNIANFRRFKEGNNQTGLRYALEVLTTEMKNVYQNMDHNSLFYYKFFWDVTAPLIT
jgi:hypothetical protein